jgi:hypothetical protein
MYFLLMNPACTLDVFTDKKLANPPKGIVRFCDNILRWWSSTSRILIENLLASQVDQKNDLGVEPILLIF